MSSRDRYLERVAVRLRMPDEASGAVLDELSTHIDDAIAAGIRNGLTADAAERDALARLGSPDELGEDLRRAHQTQRRLLVAVGAGAWQATQGAARGYLGGLVVALAIMVGGGLVVSLVAGFFRFSTSESATWGLFQVLVYPSIWGAAWLSARYLVETVSDRSLRAVELVRAPIAAIGAGLVAVPVLLLPADHTHITVALAIATPLVFAIGALTTGRDLSERIRPEAWTSRIPLVKRTVYVAFVVLVIGSMVVSALLAGLSEPVISGPDGAVDEPLPPPPAQQRWKAAGFDVVAPTVVEFDEISLAHGFARNGFLIADVPDDRIDWDEWTRIRFEVWPATSPRNGDGQQAVVGGVPLAVVPEDDPWAPGGTAVRVGYPGAEGFLLFLIAEDPVTGDRFAFGRPEGDVSHFHGSVLDWFALQ